MGPFFHYSRHASSYVFTFSEKDGKLKPTFEDAADIRRRRKESLKEIRCRLEDLRERQRQDRARATLIFRFEKQGILSDILRRNGRPWRELSGEDEDLPLPTRAEMDAILAGDGPSSSSPRDHSPKNKKKPSCLCVACQALVSRARAFVKNVELEARHVIDLRRLRKLQAWEEERLLADLYRARDEDTLPPSHPKKRGRKRDSEGFSAAAAAAIITERAAPSPWWKKIGSPFRPAPPPGRGIESMENCPEGVEPTIPLHPRAFKRLLADEF